MQRCSDMSGTSSAAPIVSGVIALMLQANPRLGWRDVQDVLVRSSTKVDSTDTSWATNAAGLSHSYKYGFGRVDALAAVTASIRHGENTRQATCTLTSRERVDIPDDR